MKNLIWAFILGLTLTADFSLAANWKNTTKDGKWETPGNWDRVPGSNDTVRFSIIDPCTLSTVSPNVLQIQIGVDNPGNLIIDGGSVTTTGSWNGLGAGNGFVPGKTATLTIKGGGSLTSGSSWRLGVTGSGGTITVTMLSGTLTAPGYEHSNALYSPTTLLKGGTLIINGPMIINYGTVHMDGGKIIVNGDQEAYAQQLIASGRMVLGETRPAGQYYIKATFDGGTGKTTIEAVPEPTGIPLLGLGVLTSP